MKIKKVALETVCGITSKLPDNKLPEFAFAGKSNVGKSSLTNALMQRKSLARTSRQPGKTQTINFYNVNDAFYLVDLPGYGYARVGKEVSARWGAMIEGYLRQSRQLKLVFLLLDIRHEPSDNDRKMFDWIVKTGFRPVIIATKSDKIKRSQLAKQCKILREGVSKEHPEIKASELKLIPFSALNKNGLEEIYALFEEELGGDAQGNEV